MTLQCSDSNQSNPVHKNPSSSGISSNLSCTPFFEHMFTDTTVRHATANMLPGFAVAVMRQQQLQRRLICLTRHITQLKNKVHQAMAEMDKGTGKLLNYRQLINSPKYNKAWSLSAANKF